MIEETALLPKILMPRV